MELQLIYYKKINIHNFTNSKMKKIVFLLSLFLISTIVMSQDEGFDDILRQQLDSVLVEGTLLYKYEKAAWVATDMIMKNQSIIENYGGYFTYEDNGNIVVIFLSRSDNNCIAECHFKDDFAKPDVFKAKARKLRNKEVELLKVRSKIFENLSSDKHSISIPDGYSPNFILLPFAEKYKLYMIMGTTQIDVIPFGNDYLIVADMDGNIESLKSFHSRIIPAYTNIDGKKVREIFHSHLKTTPLISATDICTFKLYAPLYDVKKFTVYSPALEKYMTFNLEINEISVKGK